MDDDILKMVLESELAAAQPKKKEPVPARSKETPSSNPKNSQAPVEMAKIASTEALELPKIGSAVTASKNTSADKGEAALNHGLVDDDSDALLRDVLAEVRPNEPRVEVANTAEPEVDSAELQSLHQKIAKHEQEIAQLKAQIQVQKDQIKQHKHDVEAMRNQRIQIEADYEKLRVNKSKDRSLHQVFKKRGLIGKSEIEAAFKALSGSHKISELFSAIGVIDAPKIQRILDEHIQLVSVRVPKELKHGMAQVQVSEDRCELLGQHELAKTQRRFIDGLTVNGFRNVLILGAPVRMLAPLKALASHHQITFSFGPAVHRLTTESIAQLISDHTVVLVWNPQQHPFDVSILPQKPHVYSEATKLAAFLLECGEALLSAEDGDDVGEA